MSALSDKVRRVILDFPLLGVTDGFWERAGKLRSAVLAKGRKARLGDALIAQLAVDHKLLLVTRDSNFDSFASVSKLKILHGVA